MKDKDKANSIRKTFEFVLLMGSAVFLEKLVPPETLTEHLHFDRINSRRFLLLRVLTEVQKVGLVMKRWNRYLDQVDQDKSDNIEFQILSSLIDEQSLWQRKLLEGLALIINFSITNELVFYYHFLMLQELTRYRYMLSEQRDFFCHENALTRKTVDTLMSRVREIGDEIGDLTQCWYLTSTRNVSSNPNLASFRMQMKTALNIASLEEKRALGYTYDSTYGETSGNIHFSATRQDYTDMHERFSFGIAQCSLLGIALLKRAHMLTDIQPSDINAQLSSVKLGSEIQDGLLIADLKVGDFVIVGGPYLGQIESIEESVFGYKSYKLRLLSNSPIEGVNEGWFPSVYVHPYLKREELLNDIYASFEADKQKGISDLSSFTESDIEQAVHDSVMETWHVGMEAYMKKNMTFRRVGELGLGHIPNNEA